MAGIDLLSGHVHANIVERHRSREFIAFLKSVDQYYPQTALIRIVPDNHSAHISKETRAYLASVPNRFEFIFTPKHGSWLNIIETFFSKMARSFLRGIRYGVKLRLDPPNTLIQCRLRQQSCMDWSRNPASGLAE